jgi:hypothetical protein
MWLLSVLWNQVADPGNPMELVMQALQGRLKSSEALDPWDDARMQDVVDYLASKKQKRGSDGLIAWSVCSLVNQMCVELGVLLSLHGDIKETYCAACLWAML